MKEKRVKIRGGRTQGSPLFHLKRKLILSEVGEKKRNEGSIREGKEGRKARNQSAVSGVTLALPLKNDVWGSPFVRRPLPSSSSVTGPMGGGGCEGAFGGKI